MSLAMDKFETGELSTDLGSPVFFANVVSDDMDAYLQTRTPDVSPILYTGSGLPFFNQH